MQSKKNASGRRRLLGLAVAAAALTLQGCATQPTSAEVSRDTALQATEGVVTLRVVHLSDFKVRNLIVQADGSGQKYEMVPVHYGQTDTVTFVGRVPAGRYQPVEMKSMAQLGLGTWLTSPLARLTGKFDVEARRVTDLGTMVHVPMLESETDVKSNRYARTSTIGFVLPLDPTPVPTEKLLAARFPMVAASVAGRSPLGWVAGTVPSQPPGMLAAISARAELVAAPALLGAGRAVSAGRVGVVVDYRAGAAPVRRQAGTVHQLQSVLVLKDGRWLVGGEEGFVAVSDDGGVRWQRVAGLEPDQAVIHLAQAPNGMLYLVAMGDNATTVYASPAAPLAWKPVRQVRSQRQLEASFVSGPREKDAAVSTRERLVIHTYPETLTTLDYATGQWETQKTPRNFPFGMIASPDGLVVGINASMWLTGTQDYGRTWTRLEGWVNSTLPTFVDRTTGYVISAALAMTPEHQLRRTDDGGRTWKAVKVSSLMRIGQPLWAEPDGQRLFTLADGRLMSSQDLGRTWQ